MRFQAIATMLWGRINAQFDYLPSGYSSHFMQYDLAGNLTQLTYPDGRVVTQGYDSAGRLNSSAMTVSPVAGQLSQPYSYVSAVSYSPNGVPSSTAYGNGVTQYLSFNNRLQPCQSGSYSQPASLGEQTFAYYQYYYSKTEGVICGTSAGNNGNIWNIADVTNAEEGNQYSQSFSYDSLNRISGWNTNMMAGQGRTLAFSYDSFGNVTQSNLANMASYIPILPTSYDAKNHLMLSSFGCLPSSSTNAPDPNNPGYDLAGERSLFRSAGAYGSGLYLRRRE